MTECGRVIATAHCQTTFRINEALQHKLRYRLSYIVRLKTDKFQKMSKPKQSSSFLYSTGNDDETTSEEQYCRDDSPEDATRNVYTGC